MRNKRGFTLIELLVVIAIIGILSAIILASLNAARVNARDARRISDIKELQSALELYAQEHGYTYPVSLTALAPTYITSVPADPLTGLQYSYKPLGSNLLCSTPITGYHLGASLENSSNPALTGASHTAKSGDTGCSTTDFDGRSAAAGGQPCSVTPGSPTTCYDIHS